MTLTRSVIQPYLALVVAVTALLLAPFFIRWANAPAVVTVFFRMAVGAMVFLPFYARRTPQPEVAPRRAYLYPALGGFFLGGDLILWATGVNSTQAAVATLLSNLAPLWVALVAWFFLRERLKWFFWVGLAAGLGGVALVVRSNLLESAGLRWGDLLSFTSSFFYAGYYLTTQRGRSFFRTARYLWVMNISGVVLVGLFLLVTGTSLLGYPLKTYLLFIANGLLVQVIGHFAIAYALGHLPAAIVSPTMISQPVIVSLMSVPLLGERLQPVQWLGTLAAVTGIFLVNLSRRSTQSAP